jgi:alpha-N-arabinofuranosidase
VSHTRLGKPASFWGLEGSASLRGKQLVLTVVNPHASEARETEIVVRGARVESCQARVLSATDIHAHNSFTNPRALEPREQTVSVSGGSFVYQFLPASVTRLQLTLT